MLNLNDGILKVYAVERDKEKGPERKMKGVLVYLKDMWYEELAMGVSEYYLDKQAQALVEMRVRIHRDKSISSQNVIVIGDKQYRPGRVVHGFNKSQIPITDISLERTEYKYDFK